MAVRKKRSISMPPDLDSTIEAAARAEGVSNSGWPAEVARKEFTVRAGLDAVTGFERAHGRFTREEMTEAETWPVRRWRAPSGPGARERRSA